MSQNQASIVNQPQVIAFPLIALLVIVTSLLAVLVPQLRGISEGREKLKEDKEVLAKMVAKRQLVEELDEQELNQTLIVLNRILPNDKPVFQAVGMMVNQASKASVGLSTYSLEPGMVGEATAAATGKEDKATMEMPGKLNNLPLEFSVEGSFENIYSLLTNWELTAPLSKVNSLDMTGFSEAVEASDYRDLVSAKLGATIYYAPPPATMGKLTDELPEISQAKWKLVEELKKYQETATISAEPMLPDEVPYPLRRNFFCRFPDFGYRLRSEKNGGWKVNVRCYA